MREIKTTMPEADILIVGGGIIGMSVAMEMRSRGVKVLVLEKAGVGQRTSGIASWAAAGMIAAEDPYNPLELRELSLWSAGLYDSFLGKIEMAGGLGVPYQTERAVQYLADGSTREMAERSVNPRELFQALRAAVGELMVSGVEVAGVNDEAAGVVVQAADGRAFRAEKMVWANGAWAKPWMEPRKGQMMRVRLAEPLTVVHRREHLYVVPRTSGEQAGTALVGATLEDAGFDARVHAEDLSWLREMAAEMVPAVRGAEVVESWAGFRPTSKSGLPVMGKVPGSERQFVCGGHFRNGILLAPGSAVVMADLLTGVAPEVDVAAFGVEFAHDGR